MSHDPNASAAASDAQLSAHAARLVSQRDFVRGLARRLVAPADVDDVAQEVLARIIHEP